MTLTQIISKKIRKCSRQVGSDTDDKELIYFLDSVKIETATVSGVEGTVGFDVPRVPKFRPLRKFLGLAEDLISIPFRPEELNVIALKTTLSRWKRDTDVLLLQRLQVTAEDIFKVADEQVLSAFNAILDMPDLPIILKADLDSFHGIIKNILKKMLRNSPHANTVTLQERRTLNRYLLQVYYPHETAGSHLRNRLMAQDIGTMQVYGKPQPTAMGITVAQLIDRLEGRRYITLRIPSDFKSKILGNIFEAMKTKMCKSSGFKSDQSDEYVALLKKIFSKAKQLQAGDERRTYLESELPKLQAKMSTDIQLLSEISERARAQKSGRRLTKTEKLEKLKSKEMPVSLITFFRKREEHYVQTKTLPSEIARNVFDDYESQIKLGTHPSWRKDLKLADIKKVVAAFK